MGVLGHRTGDWNCAMSLHLRLLTQTVALTVAILFMGIAVACDSDDEDLPEDAPSGVPQGSSVADDPFITATGVRMPLITESETGSTERICETDAIVNFRDGKVVDISKAPAIFEASPGEQLYRDTGEEFTDPTLLGLPVYRDEDGRLIFGWLHCEETPLGSLATEPVPEPKP